jgi:dihydrofolate reductase
MTNSVYIATSLDGFIATTDGGLDWLTEIPNPNNEDYGYAEFMTRMDAIILGRVTFEKVLTFDHWPYEKPTFVLTNSLKSLPAGLNGKAEIINGELRELLGKIHARGYGNLYIDGGRTIQTFIAEDLIDEMIITQIPILLGSGIPLFGFLADSMWFSLQKTEIYGELVKSTYFRRFVRSVNSK